MVSLSSVFLHCSIYPESPVVNDDVCTGTQLVHACHVISFLLDVIIIMDISKMVGFVLLSSI